MSDFSLTTVADALNGVVAGTAGASKAVVLGADSKINTLDITALKINGTAVDASADEIDTLDGLTRGSIIVGGAAGTTVLDAKNSGQILVGDGNDIKSVVVGGDATLASDGILALAVPKLSYINKICAIADFTDNNDTTGYIDFANNSLPAGAIVVGFKAVVAGEFKGDVSATIQVGVAGTLGKFSASTTQSVFTTGTVGSGAPMDTCFNATASTPRITVTSASDFGLVVTDGTGAMTVYLYYIVTT